MPFLYACAQPALHTRFTDFTNSMPSPSVRICNLSMQPENTTMQPPQGVLTFYLVNTVPAHLDARVRVRARFKLGVQRGSRATVQESGSPCDGLAPGEASARPKQRATLCSSIASRACD